MPPYTFEPVQSYKARAAATTGFKFQPAQSRRA
jgi:hypothetical protein